MQPSVGGSRDAEVKETSAENLELSFVLTFRFGVGQDIASLGLPIARAHMIICYQCFEPS